MTRPAISFAVDDEIGNQITCGLESYSAAMQVARRYLAAHDDAPAVRIYEDQPDGETWDLSRGEVLQ